MTCDLSERKEKDNLQNMYYCTSLLFPEINPLALILTFQCMATHCLIMLFILSLPTIVMFVK